MAASEAKRVAIASRGRFQEPCWLDPQSHIHTWIFRDFQNDDNKAFKKITDWKTFKMAEE